MKQWITEYAVDTRSGPKVLTESFYMPSEEDVRREISKRGGHPLTIRQHERSPIERLLARSTWWQVQLLRGIQFRSTATSPGVALWRLIAAETNPMRQNILAPAREALSRGLGVMDALKALNIFDHSTLAILSASERSNKLNEGIPHAIETVTQKRKNMRAIGATMTWLGLDLIMIVQAMFWGKGFIIDWFKSNKPTDPAELEKYNYVVGNLELLWNVLTYLAVAFIGFLIWCIISFFMNKGKKDWPTAKIVRSIPLIGAYMRDLGFADSMSAAMRMLKGTVPIGETLQQAADATSVPDISEYWEVSLKELNRGVSLGAALDHPPLTKNERMELASLSDLSQVATIMESIAEMRQSAAKTKHSLIVWSAFALSAVYLTIAFGSAIYALTVMNMSMDSMMGGLLEGAI